MRIHSIEVDEAGIAMIYLVAPAPGLSVRQFELLPKRVIADLDKRGRVVAVEILDPRLTEKFFGPSVEAVLDEFDIAAGRR